MRIAKPVTVFLCGDVMLGRGIDQILPFPLPPEIHEGYLKNAQDYVRLAEQKNAVILRPVDFEYIWSDALDELQNSNPEVRIVNLETAITTHSRWDPKGINYRMHPLNIPILKVAQIDVAVLANNHVLDWKRKGLTETLQTLKNEKIQTVGAGADLNEASAPAVIQIRPDISVNIFAFALESSGVPEEWAAGDQKPGVHFLPDLSLNSLQKVRQVLRLRAHPQSVVILSLHWGGNWGYEISQEQSQFARTLIDDGLVDVIYGHSSHHPKGIEVYKGKLVLYGCGDLINDYEGIGGYESYRSDLVLLYFLKIHPLSKKLLALKLVPFQLKNFQLKRPEASDIQWMYDNLVREERKFNHQVDLTNDQQFFRLRWS